MLRPCRSNRRSPAPSRATRRCCSPASAGGASSTRTSRRRPTATATDGDGDGAEAKTTVDDRTDGGAKREDPPRGDDTPADAGAADERADDDER